MSAKMNTVVADGLSQALGSEYTPEDAERAIAAVCGLAGVGEEVEDFERYAHLRTSITEYLNNRVDAWAWLQRQNATDL